MYEVGVLRALVENTPDDIKYDVIAGVSAGAANGGTLSMYAPGQEKDAID